ncbi:hypothetical protein [Priestia megaterium]|uniref:hypothetical protein n=1 Tax=Priestia megaterium TaxID=1404 RepID=UPI00112EFA7F|nr:hypothetical protein [Priestia megaterium]TPF17956.1 hypothetical protein CBE78_01660 [Priestia megaterium]TPF22064.1 hypothetical protein CBE79_04165 [Priestia megaterium]
MITDVCVFALGGCGGNFGDEFAQRNFYSVAVNFSQSDLNSLHHVHDKLKLIGSEGLGHQRSEALELVSNHVEVLTSFIHKHCEHASVVIVPFSTGGGSGSGLSPLTLNLLSNMYPDKAIIAMPIIPHNEESTTALMNNQQVFEELSNIEGICIAPVDNQKAKSRDFAIGKAKIYNVTNKSIVDHFHALYSYTNESSKSGSFDKKDFINLFKQEGYCSIAEVIDVSYWLEKEKLILNPSNTKKLLRSVLNASMFAPIEYDSIGKAAIIIDTEDEDVVDNIDNSIFDDFANRPIDVFEGIYNNEQSNFLMVVLTGLSMCQTRLSEIDEVLEKRQQELENLPRTNTAFKSKFSSLSLPSNKPAQKKEKLSTQDILNMYKKR